MRRVNCASAHSLPTGTKSFVCASSEFSSVSERLVAAPYRLAGLTAPVVEYQAPLFRLLASTSRISPHVMFCFSHGAGAYWDEGFGKSGQWGVPLLDGCRHEFLPNGR